MSELEVYEWKDKETNAIGWLVMDGKINGVAGGGIFMHSGATEQETIDIARNMSKKFTVTQPQISGAKAGIRFNHLDPRAKEVLRRFIIYMKPFLQNCWVTAGDLNTDDMFIEEVIQKDVGLQNCQATLGRKYAEATGQANLTYQLKEIIKFPACEYFPLIEAAVGYGLAESILSVVKLRNGDKPTVCFQGFGAVGSSACYYLWKKGIKITGISDKDGFITCTDGLPIESFLAQRKQKLASLVDQKEKTECSKNLICILTNEQKKQYSFRSSHETSLKDFLKSAKANVFSPCAVRYQITPEIVQFLIEDVWNETEERYIIAGANNSLGIINNGVLVEDTSGTVLKMLYENKIAIIPDWVSNSGTAQLFHRGLSVPFDLSNSNVAEEILEACAIPIRSYIQVANEMSESCFDLYKNCDKLAGILLKSPRPFIDQQAISMNPGCSRYALAPPKDLPSYEERMYLVMGCFDRIGGEIIQKNELRELLTRSYNPVAYDGFEPSGRLHLAQVIMKKNIVNRMTRAGFTFLFWVADWFAFLNHKLGGKMANIQLAGHYMIETWKAAGMNMERVKFLWASAEFDKFGSEYWARVLDISTKNTVTNIKNCTQIMGRKNTDDLSASQMFYPCMQCADIFFLGVDVCQLGMDQRKVNVLAREYAAKAKLRPPVIMGHPMIPGLKKSQEKASKSDPESAIFMDDDDSAIERKIMKAFCEEKIIEGNPCIVFYKLLVYESLMEKDPKVNFIFDDGHNEMLTFAELETNYLNGNIHPMTLKKNLTREIQEMVRPVRQHFVNDPFATNLQIQMTSMMQSLGK